MYLNSSYSSNNEDLLMLEFVHIHNIAKWFQWTGLVWMNQLAEYDAYKKLRYLLGALNIKV